MLEYINWNIYQKTRVYIIGTFIYYLICLYNILYIVCYIIICVQFIFLINHNNFHYYLFFQFVNYLRINSLSIMVVCMICIILC